MTCCFSTRPEPTWPSAQTISCVRRDRSRPRGFGRAAAEQLASARPRSRRPAHQELHKDGKRQPTNTSHGKPTARRTDPGVRRTQHAARPLQKEARELQMARHEPARDTGKGDASALAIPTPGKRLACLCTFEGGALDADAPQFWAGTRTPISPARLLPEVGFIDVRRRSRTRPAASRGPGVNAVCSTRVLCGYAAPTAMRGLAQRIRFCVSAVRSAASR